MPAKKQSINLLPQEEFEKSSWGRTLRWATTTFRTIVIITELVVILAFLSRFWLDAKNADLNDILRQNEDVITTAYGNLEEEFNGIRKGIKIFSDLNAETPLSLLVTKAVNLLPDDVQLLTISRAESSLQIRGSSASERSIVQYITNLASEPAFKEVKVTNATASSENQAMIVFILEINLLNKEKGK